MLTTTRILFFIIVLFPIDIRPDVLMPSKDLNAAPSSVESVLGEKNSLEDTVGVITLNKKVYTKSRKLQFFNEDGSLWYEFSFYEDNADHKFDQAKVDFRPFAFHRDYFVLTLKCVGEDGNRFQVVVNEKTRLTKFISRHDAVFRFQTWQTHILDLFAVGFNWSNNPVRTRPGDSVRTVQLPPDQLTFHPIQINGKWLKVSWNSSDGSKGKKVGYGWVKWKQNRQLLVEFFYFS